MREWIDEGWISVMDADYNPLRHVPDMQVRHMILQVLAWMYEELYFICVFDGKRNH